jgi:NADH:ubiquinone oxidoreductase subunit F (NADH-binding)/NADH:ubiquinone oxidoreductase subunit E
MNKPDASKDFKPVPPGGASGKRRARATPKGRQLDPQSVKDIRGLLGEAPRRRDLLIEYLHLVQDKYGCIGANHLAALASEMRIPMAEAYEVATFYHHFDVVKEGQPAPPEITIRVCDSLSCELAEAQALIVTLKAKAPQYVRVVHAPCMGRCHCAPAAAVGKNYVDHAEAGVLLDLAKRRQIKTDKPKHQHLEQFVQSGGYETIAALRKGATPVEQVIDTLMEAGLRGLGGAGFPSGKKWQFVRAGAGPRYLCVNGDEGEPGTFKDKHYLESNPHQFLEGVLIAAWGVEAKEAYVYLRDEYPAAREILAAELAAIEGEGIVARGFIHLRRGAGAYICGEESAMIESIEGKRGFPRHRPPYVAQVGLFGQPTLVHNVETLYWMPEILRKGAEWFAQQGKPGHKGLRSYSVSGRVKRPGVVLAAAGSSANELIALCGGMAEGHTFKGYLPGGASGGILPASMADLPLDFGELEKHGCFVGSHAVVILSHRDDMRMVAHNLLKFFAEESCGQCTPCRVGCEKAVKLLSEGPWDQPLLCELSQVLSDASICGLGQAAPNPIRSVMKFFPEDSMR